MFDTTLTQRSTAIVVHLAVSVLPDTAAVMPLSPTGPVPRVTPVAASVRAASWPFWARQLIAGPLPRSPLSVRLMVTPVGLDSSVPVWAGRPIGITASVSYWLLRMPSMVSAYMALWPPWGVTTTLTVTTSPTPRGVPAATSVPFDLQLPGDGDGAARADGAAAVEAARLAVGIRRLHPRLHDGEGTRRRTRRGEGERPGEERHDERDDGGAASVERHGSPHGSRRSDDPSDPSRTLA